MRKSVIAVALVFFGTSIVAACDSESSSSSSGGIDAGPQPAVDGSLPDTSTPDTGLGGDGGGMAPDAPTDAGAQCHTVAQVSTKEVSWITTIATAPTPAGGTIVDGTYTLDSFVHYTNAAPEGTVVAVIGRSTALLENGTLSVVTIHPTVGERRSTEPVMVVGLDFNTTETCLYPPQDAGVRTRTAKYTATPTSLALTVSDANGPIVYTYLKR